MEGDLLIDILSIQDKGLSYAMLVVLICLFPRHASHDGNQPLGAEVAEAYYGRNGNSQWSEKRSSKVKASMKQAQTQSGSQPLPADEASMIMSKRATEKLDEFRKFNKAVAVEQLTIEALSEVTAKHAGHFDHRYMIMVRGGDNDYRPASLEAPSSTNARLDLSRALQTVEGSGIYVEKRLALARRLGASYELEDKEVYEDNSSGRLIEEVMAGLKVSQQRGRARAASLSLAVGLGGDGVGYGFPFVSGVGEVPQTLLSLSRSCSTSSDDGDDRYGGHHSVDSSSTSASMPPSPSGLNTIEQSLFLPGQGQIPVKDEEHDGYTMSSPVQQLLEVAAKARNSMK